MHQELDSKIIETLARIASHRIRKAESEEGDNLGFAVIGRYTENKGRITNIERVELRPGEGILFERGAGSQRFLQEELFAVTKRAERGGFETLAFLDFASGSLFFGRGRESKIIGSDNPQGTRYFNAQIGNVKYGIVWGENKSEVEHTLAELVVERYGGI